MADSRPKRNCGRLEPLVRFKAEIVLKWNCVFRERSESGVLTGERRFRMLVAVGAREEVRQTLEALTKEFADRGADNREISVEPNKKAAR